MDESSQRSDSRNQDDTTRPDGEFRGFRTPSRRTFVATGAALSGATVAGCLGGIGSSNDGDGPEAPWTTEELADHIDDGSTITIYAGTGDSDQWYDLIEVINDEFGTSLEGDVFAGNGGDVSQRFLQEKQADNDRPIWSRTRPTSRTRSR